ncbi:S8 family peptidase [Vibrio sp. AND4]|uniref:S8 family peptidase n=1 Tax=Vibrio sp. AND4 TaxID=314289 RepID=UPI00015EF8AE|nr:S8 family peptidase [Vibrio sp. AND4]EDP57203.1 microbial serine proteinase [Vibrio sp. AND4]
MLQSKSLALSISVVLGSTSFVVQAGVSTDALNNTSGEICGPLDGTENIRLTRDSIHRCLTGNDPFKAQQWHLMNTGQDGFALRGGVAGNDLNLWWAHRRGIYGEGVNVAVVDDGLEIGHPDLAANITPNASYDFVGQDRDPTPTSPGDAHGTSVAGIIAAVRDNNIGGQGVAPEAALRGFNFLGRDAQTLTNWYISHGQPGRSDDVRIFNQSYGIGGIASGDYSDNFMERTYRHMSMNSNNGLGAAFIKSAGNGYNIIGLGGRDYIAPTGNNSGLPWQNSNQAGDNANYWNIVVSALNADGERSSYSTVGSNVFLTALGGEYGSRSPAHVTTDLTGCDMGYNSQFRGVPHRNHLLHGSTKLDPTCDYNSTMNGTSSAAPNTSGAFALMMSAYPNLTQRDIRHLLATTATQVDENYGDISLTYTTDKGRSKTITGLEGWQKNSVGRWFSPYYGFGLVNVNAALKAAETYEQLPPLDVGNWVSSQLVEPLVIQDAGETATNSTIIKQGNKTVESVQVRLNIDHQRMSDLLIELESPAGTRSILMSPRNGMVGHAIGQGTSGFRDHPMLTHKFYGESGDGNWTLHVTDTSGKSRSFTHNTGENGARNVTMANNRENGQLKNWSLRIFGH